MVNDVTGGKAILVVGPEGSGKTFLSNMLRSKGLNAIDTDSVDKLARWTDMHGRKIKFPEKPDTYWFERHKFCIYKNKLRALIRKRPVVVFALAHNLEDIIDMFDEIYYLKVNKSILDKRLRKRDGNAYAGLRQLAYIKELDRIAKDNGFRIIRDSDVAAALMYFSGLR